MFVELIYDRRNVAGIPGANELILAELTRRIQRVYPDATVKVKPMMTNSSVNTDASKHEKAWIHGQLEEMFEEADMWLVGDN